MLWVASYKAVINGLVCFALDDRSVLDNELDNLPCIVYAAFGWEVSPRRSPEKLPNKGQPGQCAADDSNTHKVRANNRKEGFQADL